MPERRIAELVRRIDSVLGASGGDVVRWEGAATEAAIQRVERTLGCALPRSFRTFLALTGGGGLESFWISAASSDGDDGGGSVVGDTTFGRQAWGMPAHLVVVQLDPDHNEPFCLDTSRAAGDECPVVLFHPLTRRTSNVADDFLAFYERYLELRFAAATKGA